MISLLTFIVCGRFIYRLMTLIEKCRIDLRVLLGRAEIMCFECCFVWVEFSVHRKVKRNSVKRKVDIALHYWP